MNVVIIPAFNRAEFLTVCLDQIVKNPDFKENFYLLSFDNGGRGDNVLVFNNWLKIHSLKGQVSHRSFKFSGLMKQSWNVISAYREAIEISDDLVYLLEDDVLVSPYFFQWHKTVQKLGDFCSIGTRSLRIPHEVTENLSLYYTTHDYQSLGVCFQRDNLRYALTMFTDGYFENPTLAIKRRFGENPPISLNYVEQDAMFHNLIKAEKLSVAFPIYGFAFHAGFQGKSRGKKVIGSLAEKVSYVRSVVFDEAKMRQIVLDNGDPIAYFEDSKPINLNLQWDGTLRKVL